MNTVPGNLPVFFDKERHVKVTVQDMYSTGIGMPQEFRDSRSMYRYLHRCFREIRRFSDNKPFKNNRDATIDTQCAIAALIWARKARKNIFMAVYSHYR